MGEFQDRVKKQGLEPAFLHCCINDNTERFCSLLNEHIPFQKCSVRSRTEEEMVIDLDFGSFIVSYKLYLKPATCNEANYSKKIAKIETIE